jgi:hypothetical protein
MVRPARQQSSDATFHAQKKNFMSKGRDEQKGTPKDPRDEPRHHGGQGDEREHQDDRREDRISHDREERTQRTEPRR